MRFPSNVEGVLAVGAIDHAGNRWPYSAWGDSLDLMAPSAYLEPYGNVRTLSTNDGYRYNFGGTSAACPQVAGAAALLLSVDSNLTEAQVRCRLRNTATDMGSPAFDNYFGAGRLNAYYAIALQDLELIDHTINGVQNYNSSNSIASKDQTVLASGAQLELNAGRVVELKPGFETQAGAVLLAQINTENPCGITPSGSNVSKGTVSIGTKEKVEVMDAAPVLKLYPNPFSGTTTIAWTLPQAAPVSIYIHDMQGHMIARPLYKQVQAAGPHQYSFNGSHLPGGVYFCRVQIGGQVYIKKMVLIGSSL